MRPWWLSTLVLALLLTACAAPQQATPTGQGLELEGTSWVVTHIDGAATLASTQPTMTFTDGTVAGLASCNRYVADFTQSGGSIDLGEVAVTAMACADEAVNAQEAAFTGALGRVSQVRGSIEAAELVDSGGTAVLSLERAAEKEPKPLVGTNWWLSGLIDGESVSSPVAGTTVTLTFTSDAVSGTACNNFRGPVSVDQPSLTIGPLASTRMACADKNEGDQETKVLALLGAVTRYAIDGDTLTLTATDSTGVIFTAG